MLYKVTFTYRREHARNPEAPGMPVSFEGNLTEMGVRELDRALHAAGLIPDVKRIRGRNLQPEGVIRVELPLKSLVQVMYLVPLNVVAATGRKAWSEWRRTGYACPPDPPKKHVKREYRRYCYIYDTLVRDCLSCQRVCPAGSSLCSVSPRPIERAVDPFVVARERVLVDTVYRNRIREAEEEKRQAIATKKREAEEAEEQAEALVESFRLAARNTLMKYGSTPLEGWQSWIAHVKKVIRCPITSDPHPMSNLPFTTIEGLEAMRETRAHILEVLGMLAWPEGMGCTVERVVRFESHKGSWPFYGVLVTVSMRGWGETQLRVYLARCP